MRLHLDFETRSELSVTDVGAAKYAAHPSTEIMSLAYALDDGPVQHLDEYELQDDLSYKVEELWRYAENPTVTFYAHNAFFEQNIWAHQMVKQHGFPEITLNRWYCTAAKAARSSLPRKLEDVGAALELTTQKDLKGHAVMLSLSRPRRVSKGNTERFWTPKTAPDKFKRMYRYNVIDVKTEQGVDARVAELSPTERKIWLMDQEMNHYGLRLDREAVIKAIELLEEENARLLGLFRKATGLNSPMQNEKFKKLLWSKGLRVLDLQGATLDKILEINESIPYISEETETILKLARQLGRRSTAKFYKMLEMLGDDDRLRGYLIYAGASRTLRWSGSGVQPQNFIRTPKGFDVEQVISDIKTYGYDLFSLIYPNVTDTVAFSIRGMIIASEDHEMFIADFSGIESRGLNWMAGQEDMLNLFRKLDAGETRIDNYCALASSILGRTITPDDDIERQMGKVGELSLGYNGGIQAFAQMSKNYRLNLDLLYPLIWPTATVKERRNAIKNYSAYRKKAEDPISPRAGMAVDIIKQRYRISRPHVRSFWREMEAAAILTVETGLDSPVRGGIWFELVGRGPDLELLMHLPSGRPIHYRKPRVVHKKRFGKITPVLTYMHQKDGQWRREDTYGGKLVENATQAVARDLMALAFLRIRRQGYKPLLSVHDEAVAENKKGVGNLEEYKALMRKKPKWAKTLPLEVTGCVAERYKKA